MIKLFLFIPFIFISLFAQAQNLLVDYTFSNVAGDTVYDASGNGNNAIVAGDAVITSPGILKIGKDNFGYLDVPPSVINGLNDFTITMNVRVGEGHFHIDGNHPMNTMFSASNSSCTYCFGLGYNKSHNRWEVTMNGVMHKFLQDLGAVGGSGARVVLVRDAGLVSFTYSNVLLGTFTDTTLLDASTFIFGRHEHCLLDCFHNNQTINGGFNRIRIWDGPVDFKLADEQSGAPSFSVFPNPLSSFATISFTLNEESHVIVELLDLTGRKLQTLVDENLSAGNHSSFFNRLSSWPTGIYSIQLKLNKQVHLINVIIQ